MSTPAVAALVVAALILVPLIVIGAFVGSIAFPNPMFRFWRRHKPARWGLVARSAHLPNGAPLWYFAAPGPADPQRLTVAVFHGRSRHRGWMLPLIARLARRWDVIAIDFPSHGDGRFGPTTIGAREADSVDQTLTWARAAGATRLAVYGVSMGGAASIIALGRSDANADVEALVTDGAFDTFWSVVEHMKRWFPGFPRPLLELTASLVARITGVDPRTVRPVDVASALPGRVVFLHGDRDWLVPRAAATRLAEASRGRGVARYYHGRHDQPANPAMQDAVEAVFAEVEADPERAASRR